MQLITCFSCGFMTTTFYAGLAGIASAVVLFFTSLLTMIYDMAVAGVLESQVFIGGMAFLYGVMFYNKATRGVWVMERGSHKWALAIFALTLLVAPYFIGSAYQNAEASVYLGTHLNDDNDGVNGWWADFYYLNTTGSLLGGGLTETIVSNGTFTVGTLSATAQDLDEWCAIYITFDSTSIWNISAFDRSNDEYVTGLGLRVTTDSGSHVYSLDFGSSVTGYKANIWDDKYFVGADVDDPTRMTIGYDSEDEVTLLASGDIILKIQEPDADEFVNGATPEFEIVIYSNTYPTQFLEYQLLFGAFFALLGIIAMRSFSISRNPRRRRYWRKYRRLRSRRRRPWR